MHGLRQSAFVMAAAVLLTAAAPGAEAPGLHLVAIGAQGLHVTGAQGLQPLRTPGTAFQDAEDRAFRPGPGGPEGPPLHHLETRAAAQQVGSIRGHVTVPDVPEPAVRPSVADLGAPDRPPVDRTRVVVYLESAPRQAFADLDPRRARMDQRGQRFLPRVLAVPAGTVIDFPNNDTTFHNVFSLSRARTFDLGRFAPGRNGAVRFNRPGIVPIFCDIHAHMSAYVLVFGHPYFAESDGNGRYEIEGVPPGEYSLAVWSELGAAPAQPVKVTAGTAIEADFTVEREP